MVDREVPSVPPWGKWGCSHPVTRRTWIFPLFVRAAEYPPSSGPCPLCLEQSPVSLAWAIWLLCSFLSESVKPPPGSPCPVLLLTCSLCSSHSSLFAVLQTHQAGPCLRAFALAVLAAWPMLFPGIPWLAPSFTCVSTGHPLSERPPHLK